MLDAVAGQDQDGAVGRESPVDQRLGDAPHARPRLAVGQARPRALCVALRQEAPLRCERRPEVELLGEALGIRPQWVGRVGANRAVRITTDHDVGRQDARVFERIAGSADHGAASWRSRLRNVVPARASCSSRGAGVHRATKFSVEGRDPFEDAIEADAIGKEHRAAAPRRESVAVHVDRVDVRGAAREAGLEHPRPFVDQRVDRALDDFLVRDRALRNPGVPGPARESDRRTVAIRFRFSVVTVAVPALAGLLAQPSLSTRTDWTSGRRSPGRVKWPSACCARIATSIPAMSSTANMPMAMPKPVRAASTCSGVAPSSTMYCVSYM